MLDTAMSQVSQVTIRINEKIPFRLFHMPCCGHMLCWVQPRYPAFCPACGIQVLLALKSGEHTRIIDDDCWIKITNAQKALLSHV
jgi:hypothetical protein